MTIHWCMMTGNAPGEQEEYRATCGYTSTNKKEFRFDDLKRVTCKECLERYFQESMR